MLRCSSACIDPPFVFRVCVSPEVTTPARVQVLTHAGSMPEQVLAAITSYFPDLRETWASDAWHLTAIDSTRGHSQDRILMHPSYILVHSDDYWTFNQRPHGLVELLLGDREFCFPTILNVPIVRTFFIPLVPVGLPCLAINIWHNGDALGFQLTSCFDGFLEDSHGQPDPGHSNCLSADAWSCPTRRCCRSLLLYQEVIL